jgi:hypothetical protein
VSARQCLTPRAREGDWLGTRFRRYAGRIRDIGTGFHGHRRADGHDRDRLRSILFGVSSDVLRAWLDYSADVAPLFPNLRCLRWASFGLEDLDICPLFLGPALTKLCFGIHGPFQHLWELIGLAYMNCPLLDSLDLGSQTLYTFRSHDAGPLTEAIRFEGLHYFRCGFELPVPFMRCIASLPQLKCFDAVVSPDLTFRGLPRVLPAVHELRFAWTSWTQTSELLSLVKSDRIRVLDVVIGHVESDLSHISQPHAVLQMLACHPSASALRDIRIVMAQSEPRMQGLLPTDLAPILDLPRLRLVVLNGFPMVDPEDILGGMLRAWPDLEELSLLPQRVDMPLAAFVDAARAHPRLRDVSCAIRITHDAGSVLTYPGAFVHYALRAIHVQDNGAVARVAVARVLCATFPGLLHNVSGDPRLGWLLREGQRAQAAGKFWSEDDFGVCEAQREAAWGPAPLQVRRKYRLVSRCLGFTRRVLTSLRLMGQRR